MPLASETSVRNRLWQRLLLRSAAVGGGILGALGLLEGLCHCWLWLTPPERTPGRWEFRATRPTPYRDAAYFGPDFLDESMRCVRIRPAAGGAFCLLNDFEGTRIRIRGGRRHTTDQPTSYSDTIYLVGGSTVFDQEVPDEWTIASCLQRLVNGAGLSYRVENLGVPAMSAAQQTLRLARTELRHGDIVLFYDGVNDVYYPVYHGQTGGWRPDQPDASGARRLKGVDRLLYPWCVRNQGWSACAKLMLRRLERQASAARVDAEALAQALRRAEAGYRDALAEARTRAEAKGARFVHFLQPHLFAHEQPTAYEKRLRKKEEREAPGLERAFATAYPRFRTALEALGRDGLVSVDLSDVLADRPDGTEFYLDFCHVNHAANARVAEALFARALRAKASD
ncbi:MAG: hypothetical protein U0793_16425 [Gemmataceae bacterium]